MAAKKNLGVGRNVRAGVAVPGGLTPTGDPRRKYAPTAAKGGPHPHPETVKQLTPKKKRGNVG